MRLFEAVWANGAWVSGAFHYGLPQLFPVPASAPTRVRNTSLSANGGDQRAWVARLSVSGKLVGEPGTAPAEPSHARSHSCPPVSAPPLSCP